MEFKLTEDGTGYAVSAGSATGKSRIVIPAEYNGKPVTEIAYNGFVRCSLKNIVIPNFQGNVAYITNALDEKEREEFSRLKVIRHTKDKKQAE